MRLIDADDLVEKHPLICSRSMKFNLDLAPTIDAVPVVHAKWVENDICEHRCTNCGNRIPFYHCYSEECDDEWDEEIDLTKFCPHCGAEMNGEPDELETLPEQPEEDEA